MYVAIINTPGYLPDSDSPPPTFDTVREAWEYLADERKQHEDDHAESIADAIPAGYSSTVNILERLAEGNFDPSFGNIDDEGVGSVTGATPGGSHHDLGKVYTVAVAEPEPITYEVKVSIEGPDAGRVVKRAVVVYPASSRDDAHDFIAAAKAQGYAVDSIKAVRS